MKRFITLFCLIAFLFSFSALVGCEKKPPEYVLKSEVGENAVMHHDLMKEQPKFLRVQKTQYERARAIEERKKARDKARGIYRRESPWDY